MSGSNLNLDLFTLKEPKKEQKSYEFYMLKAK